MTRNPGGMTRNQAQIQDRGGGITRNPEGRYDSESGQA